MAITRTGQFTGLLPEEVLALPKVEMPIDGVTGFSLSDDQIKATKRTRLVIPAGTYAGVDEDVITTSLPVVAHTTTDMDDVTAYALTKTYWSQKSELGKSAAWWNAVSGDMLENVYGKLHPGALKYYDEVGIKVPDALR